MAEWLNRAVAAIADNPIWKTLSESTTSPAGLTLIATVLIAFAVGIVIGLLVARGRRNANVVPPQGEVPGETVVAADPAAAPATPTPQDALRNELQAQGLPTRDVDQRVRAFGAGLGEFRENLTALADADPESEPLVHAVEQRLMNGELDAASSLLDQVRGRLVATGRLMADRAAKRRQMAARAAELAGDLEQARRNYAAASRLFGLAVAPLDGNDGQRVRLITKQATAAFRAGDAQGAAKLLEQVVDAVAKTEGAEHPGVARAMSRLAATRYALGDAETAETLYRQAYEINRKALGETHPWVATDINNLAQIKKRGGDLAAAEPLLRQALAIREKALGAEHPTVQRTARDHAAVLRALEQSDDAAAPRTGVADTPGPDAG